MLKLENPNICATPYDQPPSGGCVLKHDGAADCLHLRPAAFRRLCVETTMTILLNRIGRPAAFRRLCVETECG